MRASLALAALLTLSCARPAPVPEPPTELEGYWIGAPVGKEHETSTLNVAGRRFHLQGPSRRFWYEGRFRVDVAARPKTLDLTIEESETEEKGKDVRAIYRVEGEVATLAASRPGASERPSSFEPARGVVVLRFRRAPDVTEVPTSPAGR